MCVCVCVCVCVVGGKAFRLATDMLSGTKSEKSGLVDIGLYAVMFV